MSSPVEAVTARVDAEALTSRCRKGNTEVLLDGMPPVHAVVDLDSPVLGLAKRARCDYLVVAEVADAGWAAPIELKSRTFRIARVVRQLQGGAELANEWLPESVAVTLCPVLVYGVRVFGKHRRRALDRRRIEFRGDGAKVRALRHGDLLVRAFASN